MFFGRRYVYRIQYTQCFLFASNTLFYTYHIYRYLTLVDQRWTMLSSNKNQGPKGLLQIRDQLLVMSSIFDQGCTKVAIYFTYQQWPYLILQILCTKSSRGAQKLDSKTTHLEADKSRKMILYFGALVCSPDTYVQQPQQLTPYSAETVPGDGPRLKPSGGS